METESEIEKTTDFNYMLNEFDENQTSSNDESIKSVYQELAEKEHALLLAAQFGKNLIEEKEDLEKQIDIMKRNQHLQIESFEQESYELKRLIESMRNEYEAKLYELNEDLNYLNKQLKQQDENNLKKNSILTDENEHLEIISDLNEKLMKLNTELKTNEAKLLATKEKNIELEDKINEKDKIIYENSKLLGSYQLEINKLVNKQQEMELTLIQSFDEREKQGKIIAELSSKYILIENEKNELENLVFQNENELFKLKKQNQNLIYKLEKSQNGLNESSMPYRKRKSTLFSINSSAIFPKSSSRSTNYSNRNNKMFSNEKLNKSSSNDNEFNRFTNNLITNNLFDTTNLKDQSLQKSIEPNHESSKISICKLSKEIDLDEKSLNFFQINEIEQDDDEDLDIVDVKIHGKSSIHIEAIGECPEEDDDVDDVDEVEHDVDDNEECVNWQQEQINSI